MLAGWDAAPAGGARNPVPGRPRAAVRPYYEGPPSLAGRGADEGGRKPAGSGAQQGPVRARKLRPRGQKSPANKPGLRKLVRVERREAPAPSEKRVRHEGYRQRLTALHPLDFSGGLGRAPRNGAGRRRTRRR